MEPNKEVIEIVEREALKILTWEENAPEKLRRGSEAVCIGAAYCRFGEKLVGEVIRSLEMPPEAAPFREEIIGMVLHRLAITGEELGDSPSRLLGVIKAPGFGLVREYLEKLREETAALPDLGMRIDAGTPAHLAELNNWGNVSLISADDAAAATAAMGSIYTFLAKQRLPVAILANGPDAAGAAQLAEMHVLAELVRGTMLDLQSAGDILAARKRRGVLLVLDGAALMGRDLPLLSSPDKLETLVKLLAGNEASLLVVYPGRPPAGVAHRPESNLHVHRAELRASVIDPTKPDARPGKRLYIDEVLIGG